MRLIDADALKADIQGYACKPCRGYGADKSGARCEWCLAGGALERIDDAPPVDAAPIRRGKWIKRPNGEYMCSGCWFTPWYCGSPKESGYGYCPNCGAWMEET